MNTINRDKLIFRNYAASDLDACRALWKELTQQHRIIYGDDTIGGPNPGLAFDGHLKKIGKKNTFVLEYRSRVVALAGLVMKDGEAEIDPVVVRKRYRGEGIGTMLMDELCKAASAMGIRYLCVRPVARNREAMEFYHKMGYTLLGQVEMFMDLRPVKTNKWKKGPSLFGLPYGY
jgi:predicted GNAT family acetyltransferase